MTNQLRKYKDILAYFKEWNLTGEAKEFLKYHCRRYEFLLKKVDKIILESQEKLHNEPLKILDIGPSFQTEILRKTLPQTIVNTLGFENPMVKPRLEDKHFQFDLNNTPYQEKWPKIEEHDLIIMAEVIEHLHTSPIFVLKCISTWLKKGHYLIIQTPNACALHKRLKMLVGKNPYPMIREIIVDPAHFHEYTLKELISVGNQAGLVPVEYNFCNYFDRGTISHKTYNILSNILPSGLRQGITISFKKS